MIKVEQYSDVVSDFLLKDTVNEKRQELINQRKWLGADAKKSVRKKYESPYRNKAVKTALKAAYKNKCAFCEQKLSNNENFPNQLTIEHFRPKSRYYWLAYSYDNLLPTCSDCNSAKDNDFETLVSTIIKIDAPEINAIHALTAKYNQIEQPKFIHPELEDLSTEFIYLKDGTVTSNNIRCQYVIDTCQLCRPKLILKRRKIINKIKAQLKAIIKDESTRDFELINLKNYLKKKGESKNQEFSNLYAFLFRNFENLATIIL